MHDEATLQIGEVVRQAGVTIRTVRCYEEMGLLSAAGRSPEGTRRHM